MAFTHKATSVKAHFDADGAVHPYQFGRLQVSDVGRQWTKEDGRHVLVMVGGRQVFELLLERQSLTWFIVRAPDTTTAV